MQPDEVRNLRGKETGGAFGKRVRAAVAEVLGIPEAVVPSVSHTQVSRWETRGLDPTTGKISTLVYLVALGRLRAGR